jgi:uncharacterized membrane protein
MIVVRYAALVAVVIWLGVLQNELFADRSDYATWLGVTCGVITMVALFAMKFLGPPPHAFAPRAAIVALMVVLTFIDYAYHASKMPAAINACLGFVLLSWYARE